MKQMTEQHLINAFGGESQAHMRYLHFADQAEKENFPNIARLFRAISHAEYVHAGDHYRELKHLEGGFVANSMAAFGPGDTKKNLKLAIMGENFEITEMYPLYIEVAKYQGEFKLKFACSEFKTFNSRLLSPYKGGTLVTRIGGFLFSALGIQLSLLLIMAQK